MTRHWRAREKGSSFPGKLDDVSATSVGRLLAYLFHLGGGKDFSDLDAPRDQRLNVRLRIGDFKQTASDLLARLANKSAPIRCQV